MPIKTVRPTPFSGGSSLDAVKSRARERETKPASIPPLHEKPITATQAKTMEQQAALFKDKTNPVSPQYDPQLRYAKMTEHLGQPSQLPPERKPLSKSTVEGLEALAEYQKKAKEAEKSDLQRLQENQSVPSLSNGDAAPDKELSETDEEFMRLLRAEFDKTRAEQDKLRKLIEGRCAPLSLEQLIEEGELRQAVPIVDGKFTVTFRTLSGEENLAIKRMMFGVRGSDELVNDLLSMYLMTAGVYAINNSILPSHLDAATKKLDREKFQEKFELVSRYPLPMIASMSINFSWFDQRTRGLFVDIEPLKNG